MSKTRREVWIGLVDVKPKVGSVIFNGAPGAYSNIVALARDEFQYRWLVDEVLGELGLEVIGFEDVEPLAKRLGKPPQDDAFHRAEFRELASQLSEAVPVLYDTFYVYRSEEWE